MRHTDLNIDGYDDLLLTLELEDSRGVKFNQSLVLMSQDCSEGVCPQAAVDREIPRRYFNSSDKIVDLSVIGDIAGPDSVMLVPMDIDEDGRMDILVQKNSKGTYGLSLIYNNYQFDSFFIKAIMLSQKSDNPNDRTFGAVTTGASYRYIVTTLDDKKYMRVAT